MDIFYYKTSQGQEIDFLLFAKNKIESLIQVVYSFKDKSTREREINALLNAMQETELTSAMILTYDQSEKIKINGKLISVVPVYQWLLTK